MDIEQLRCVLAVEQYGTFLDASFQLNHSQSSVSKSIQRLEDELGVRIFARTPRRVELTPFGREFVKQAEAILERYEIILEEAKKDRKRTYGQLRIGSITFGRNNRLDPLIARFVRLYPGIEVDMREGMTTPLMQDLRARKLDVVFASSMYLKNEPPNNFSKDPEYCSFSCYQDDYYLVVHKDHPLAKRTLVDYRDLEKEALITTERTMDVYHKAIRRAFEKHQVPFSVSMYCNSTRSVQYMVAQNLGVSILSTLVIEENENIRLVPMNDPLVRDTQMVILNQKEIPPHIKAFYQFVKRETGEKADG